MLVNNSTIIIMIPLTIFPSLPYP